MASHQSRHGLNRVFFHSAESMSELRDCSVQLAISFPPFLHTPTALDLNKRSLVKMFGTIHEEIFRVLSPNGFLVSVNSDVRDRPKHDKDRSGRGRGVWWKHQTIREICESLGLRCLATKIWVRTLKQNLYRFTYSYIVFYAKERSFLSSLDKPLPSDFRPDVWLLEGQTNFRLPNGHLFRDCLHPVIAERCILQFSEPGDLVLAPFAGVGTIPDAARRLGRDWAAYEVDESLRSVIEKRFETDSNLLELPQSRLRKKYVSPS